MSEFLTSGDLRFSFSVPRGVSGVVAGLTLSDNPTIPAHIAFGVQVSDGRYRVIESGTVRTSWVSFVELEPRFHVVRSGGVVAYAFESESSTHPQGFALPGTLIYTSTSASSGAIGAGAVLLTAGDSIVSGDFLGVTSASATTAMKPLVVTAREGRAEVLISLRPPQVIAAVDEFQSVSVAFEAPTARGTALPPAISSVEFSPLEISARAARVYGTSVALQPMEIQANAIDSTVTVVLASLEPMQLDAASAPNVTADGVSIAFEPILMSSTGLPLTPNSVDAAFQPMHAQGFVSVESAVIVVTPDDNTTEYTVDVDGTEVTVGIVDGEWVIISGDPPAISVDPDTGAITVPPNTDVTVVDTVCASGQTCNAPVVTNPNVSYTPAHAYLTMRDMLLFSFGSSATSNPKFSVILQPVTHLVDTATYLDSVGFGFSEIVMDASLNIVDTVVASSEWVIFRSDLWVSTANASDQVVQSTPHTVEVVAVATEFTVDASIERPVVSTAIASVELQAFTSRTQEVESRATGVTLYNHSYGSEVESTASATVGYAEVLSQLVESLAVAAAEFIESVGSSTDEALSSASASVEVSHLRTSIIEVVSAAFADERVLHYEPSAIAWVMNTHTSAVSWYSNYQFLDLVQVGGRVLAVGPEGLSELAGASDNGLPIQAHIDFGFKQYEVLDAYSKGRSDTKKRVDSFWFGYRASQPLELTVETYGQGLPVYRYEMPDTPADQPRNNRIRPGKKLAARYWRVSVYNSNGGSFRVDDMSADIYEMGRRI